MIRITRFLYIHILLVPMMIMSYILKSQMTFFMSFGIVLIHEMSHLIMTLLLGVEVKSMVILPFGMTLRVTKDVIRFPNKEVLIAVSGPFSNLIMILVAKFFWESNCQNINYLMFIIINWSVLLINLIPIPPLDGGRILRAILIKNAGLFKATKYVRRISRAFAVLICMAGITIIFITKGNPSLCIIGAFLIFSLVEEKKSSDILIMSELLYEKEKFKNRALIPTATLTVNYNTPASKVIKRLNLSTFYIVYIVDDNLKIIKTATESDFVRAVKKKGYSVLSGQV